MASFDFINEKALQVALSAHPIVTNFTRWREVHIHLVLVPAVHKQHLLHLLLFSADD